MGKRRVEAQDRLAGLLSLAAVALLLATVGAIFLYDAALASSLLAFILLDVVFGREAAMMFGATLQLPPWLMLVVNVVQSLALGLLATVAVLYFVDQRGRGLIGRWAREAREFADRRRTVIDRWGPLGIFMFMLVPFLAKPVIGALAGRLAGLDMRRIVVPITAATVATAAAWAYLSVTVVDLLYGLWEGSGFLLTFLLVLLGLGLTMVYRSRKRQKEATRTPTRSQEA